MLDVGVPDVAFDVLDVGSYFACAIDGAGAISCWGKDSGDWLNPPEGVFTDLSVGVAGACALRDDDAILCWGDEQTDELHPP
jgi:hypothetical protein